METYTMEAGVAHREIWKNEPSEGTRDFLIRYEDKYYYWIESSHTTANIGPFDTEEEALAHYADGKAEEFELDIDGWQVTDEDDGIMSEWDYNQKHGIE